jgi:alpha-beta hydrolase superfamily lysophospholipase
LVLVAHGAAEHCLRYARLAHFLNAAGYLVYAPDHRGHWMTAGSPDKASYAGPDGWNGIIKDCRQLAEMMQQENPGLPLFFFGHSMGSLIAQGYIQQWGAGLQGVILSGTFSGLPGIDQIMPLVAALGTGEAADQPSEIFGQMFAGFNAPFEFKTGFEWLSRDEVEVQKYVADPWCGFPFSNALVYEFLAGGGRIWQPANEARIPTHLPMYIFSGDQDPAGGPVTSVEALVERYKALGVEDITIKFYPGARHETLNETNRDEVMRDVLNWLEAHL